MRGEREALRTLSLGVVEAEKPGILWEILINCPKPWNEGELPVFFSETCAAIMLDACGLRAPCVGGLVAPDCLVNLSCLSPVDRRPGNWPLG